MHLLVEFPATRQARLNRPSPNSFQAFTITDWTAERSADVRLRARGKLFDMNTDAAPVDVWWARTVGGAAPGDPRDGELHQCFGPVRHHIDLESWDDNPDGEDWRYERDLSVPAITEGDRVIYTFTFTRSI